MLDDLDERDEVVATGSIWKFGGHGPITTEETLGPG